MEKQSVKSSDLRVIIVGGSVAGLTLAHSLQRSGIKYIVLESRNEIAPQVGASIGILGNGARVLDQLGLFDDISAMAEPLSTFYIWSKSGRSISKSDTTTLIQAR
jgi:2-polyprenyl-6-methoxyphenol hydroxylase-like FAD-dependent oxidoreductase